MRWPGVARAESSFKTARHEWQNFRKIIAMLNDGETADTENSELNSLLTRHNQKRYFRTCNVLAGTGFSNLVLAMAADDCNSGGGRLGRDTKPDSVLGSSPQAPL